MMPDQNRNHVEATNSEIDALADTKPRTPLSKAVTKALQDGNTRLWAAQRTDVGSVRERNEDSCLLFCSEAGGHFPLLPFGLYVVADGMGGHDAGHRASKVGSRTAAHHVLQKIYLPLLEQETIPDPDLVDSIIHDAVQIAHEAVYDPDPTHNGGTTLTLALILGQELYVAHVGDSRAYCLNDGNLQTVTNDHSLVQRLQDEGQLTAEEAEQYEYRNVLLRALGQEDDLEVDTYHRPLPQQGKLLLCTDGLCGLVKNPELERIMNLPISPPETTDQLVNAALKAGGFDNITAVVVEFCF
jgi:protein phosphatase